MREPGFWFLAFLNAYIYPTINTFNLGQVSLHGINVAMLERCKIVSDLSEKDLVLLVLFIELALNLSKDALEFFFANLGEIEVLSLTA